MTNSVTFSAWASAQPGTIVIVTTDGDCNVSSNMQSDTITGIGWTWSVAGASGSGDSVTTNFSAAGNYTCTFTATATNAVCGPVSTNLQASVEVVGPAWGPWQAAIYPVFTNLTASAGPAACLGEDSTAYFGYTPECGKKTRIDTNNCTSVVQTQNWCFSATSVSWVAREYWSGTEVASGSGSSASFVAPSLGKYIVIFEVQGSASNPSYSTSASASTIVEVTVPSGSIKEISFTGDHDIYEWSTSSAINDPVWTSSGANWPACYTKASAISMTVKLEVNGNLPPGQTKTVTLVADEGQSNLNASAQFSVTGNSTVTQSVTLTTTTTLSNMVYKATRTFAWKLICGNGTNSAGSSTHTIYVTYGTPAGSEVTEKRVADVCYAANGQATLDGCANAVFTHLNSFRYDLNGPNWGPSPIWLLHAGSPYSSQCPGLADFINKHFQLLGLGAGVIKYCRALPDGTYAAQDQGLAYFRSSAAGDNGHPNPTTHDDVTATETLLHLDGDGAPNNYEATCFFNGKHYAVGVGIFNTPKEVVKSSFGEINWFYNVTNNPPWNIRSCDINPWVEAP